MENEINYLFDELAFYAKIAEDTGIRISPVDNVWESDSIVSSAIKKKLFKAMKPLEEFITDDQWHPGSNKRVLDLVHPSMYPYVDGVTRTTKRRIDLESTFESTEVEWDDLNEPDKTSTSKKEASKGKKQDPNDEPNKTSTSKKKASKGKKINSTENIPDEEQVQPLNCEFFIHKNKSAPDAISKFFSEKFQWLPSDFAVDENGQVEIKSYINNLNPVTHHDLYTVITNIFEKMVPMFNNTLNDLLNIEK